MLIQFPEQDDVLESVESFLERHSFPRFGDLKNCLGRLATVDPSRALAQKLIGRCHHLEERRSVIDLAENAEALANSSPNRNPHDIAKEAHILRDRIDRFVKHHRPSRNNAKFLRFAKRCIAKAEKQERVVAKKSGVALNAFQYEASAESLALAESLYELAALVYQEKPFSIDGFDQKELAFHISVCKGDLNNPKKRIESVQGILGYAHLLADYYMDHSPYPSKKEVRSIFQDLGELDA